MSSIYEDHASSIELVIRSYDSLKEVATDNFLLDFIDLTEDGFKIKDERSSRFYDLFGNRDHNGNPLSVEIVTFMNYRKSMEEHTEAYINWQKSEKSDNHTFRFDPNVLSERGNAAQKRLAFTRRSDYRY